MEFQIFEMLFFVLSMWFNARFCFVLELDRFCFMQISYSDLKINHEKSEIQFSIICFSFDWWLESERWCQLKYRVIDIKISEIGVADSKQKTLRSADLEKKMELKKKKKKKSHLCWIELRFVRVWNTCKTTRLRKLSITVKKIDCTYIHK